MFLETPSVIATHGPSATIARNIAICDRQRIRDLAQRRETFELREHGPELDRSETPSGLRARLSGSRLAAGHV